MVEGLLKPSLLKLILINNDTKASSEYDMPNCLEELQDIEDRLNREGWDVELFYEDNSGDSPEQRRILCYQDFNHAKEHIGGQGLKIICSLKKTHFDPAQLDRDWNCRKCMRRNRRDISECITCASKKPVIPGIQKIRK